MFPVKINHFLYKKLPLLLVGVYMLLPGSIFAAELSVLPATANYKVGETFTVTIEVSPENESVNVIEAALKFDPSILSVTSVSKSGSAFSTWTTEPTFSNAAGTIKFAGGSQSPLSAQAKLLSVTFTALASGTGAIYVSDASVLKIDGNGTDVYKNSISSRYSITNTGADESIQNQLVADASSAPLVTSLEFPDPEGWYTNVEGVFTWVPPTDVTSIAIEISTSSDNQPEKNDDTIYKPTVSELKVSADDLTDGVQYLSIRYKGEEGWGEVLNRKIQIDTVPPEVFTVDVRASYSGTGFPQLNFEAVDATSGIEFYLITIAENEVVKILPDEARAGYLLRDLEDGTYSIKIAAHDKAGNIRETSIAVLISAGWVKPSEEPTNSYILSYLTPLNILITSLALALLLLTLILYRTRRQFKIKESKLEQEAKELQDQMEKIFSALRDEIYYQINLINKSPRLSKKEKQAVDDLNQALEVSKNLIDREITEVKNVLK